MRGLAFGLAKGRRAFGSIAPNPLFLIKSGLIPLALTVGYTVKGIIMDKKPLSVTIGEGLGDWATGGIGKHFMKRNLNRGIHMAFHATAKPWNCINGLGGRSEMVMRPEVDADDNGRIIKRMIIVYHHANKAGKHIDVHIGRRSVIYRVTGKPVEKLIKFNNQGMLTEVSKEALLKHVRAEITNNSRTPQNLDHSLANARCSWAYDPELANVEGYGSGPTRQVIIEQDVEFYHPSVHSSLHLYAPCLNPDQGLYMYQLYPGTEKTAPIMILGTLIPQPVPFKDRLHLKLIQPEDFEAKFKGKIDVNTATRKYDGASAYFTSNGQGFKFFSPRQSVVTGKNIEYTYKLPELADKGSEHKPVGMGEVMFWQRTPIGLLTNQFGIKGPEKVCWNYIDAASIGGILNSNSIRPRNIHPDFRVYRMDKWDGKDVHNASFATNRLYQEALRDEVGGHFNVVTLARCQRTRTSESWEGFVGTAEGASINKGLKVKWWGDDADWRVTANELSLSEKGNIQGVLEFTSLESGKAFNLGPGQIGSFDDCMALLQAKDSVVGMVAKVHGRQGHEGRACKLVMWHMDKGKVPRWFKT